MTSSPTVSPAAWRESTPRGIRAWAISLSIAAHLALVVGWVRRAPDPERELPALLSPAAARVQSALLQDVALETEPRSPSPEPPAVRNSDLASPPAPAQDSAPAKRAPARGRAEVPADEKPAAEAQEPSVQAPKGDDWIGIADQVAVPDKQAVLEQQPAEVRASEPDRLVERLMAREQRRAEDFLRPPPAAPEPGPVKAVTPAAPAPATTVAAADLFASLAKAVPAALAPAAWAALPAGWFQQDVLQAQLAGDKLRDLRLAHSGLAPMASLRSNLLQLLQAGSYPEARPGPSSDRADAARSAEFQLDIRVSRVQGRELPALGYEPADVRVGYATAYAIFPTGTRVDVTIRRID